MSWETLLVGTINLKEKTTKGQALAVAKEVEDYTECEVKDSVFYKERLADYQNRKNGGFILLNDEGQPEEIRYSDVSWSSHINDVKMDDSYNCPNCAEVLAKTEEEANKILEE